MWQPSIGRSSMTCFVTAAHTTVAPWQQVLRAQEQALEEQRASIKGELQGLSASFHRASVDNRALHQQLKVVTQIVHSGSQKHIVPGDQLLHSFPYTRMCIQHDNAWQMNTVLKPSWTWSTNMLTLYGSLPFVGL